MNDSQTKNLGLSEGKLALMSKIGYGFSGLSYMICMILPMYITYFATQSLSIAIGSVSIMILLVKILDGFSDLVAGVLIDKTKSPKGKARPWFLRMAIPYALCLTLTFYVPPTLSTAWKLILLGVLYALTVTVFGTVVGVARYSLIPLMTADQKERRLLSILGDGVGAIFAGIAIGITPVITGALGWRTAFTIYGLITFAATLLCYLLTKENIDEINAGFEEQAAEKSSAVKDFFKALVNNKYALFLLIYIILTQMAAGLIQVGGLYYFQYALNNMGLFSTVMLATVPAGLVGMILASYLARKTGKLLGIGSILASASFIVLYINDGTSMMVTMLFIIFAVVFGVTFTNTAYGFIDANTVDYGEYKTGVRIEGLTSSVANIGIKVGTALSAAILGAIMSAGGFKEGDVAQTAGAVFSIKIGYLIAPAVIFLIAGIIFFATYKLDKEYPQIQSVLSERKGVSA